MKLKNAHVGKSVLIRGFTLIELLVLIAIVAILASMVLGVVGGRHGSATASGKRGLLQESVGTRVGTVVKFSKVSGFGTITRYEGQLQVTPTVIWSFSVSADDTTVVQQLTDALNNGSKVKLTYKDTASNAWGADTTYRITAVADAGTDQSQPDSTPGVITRNGKQYSQDGAKGWMVWDSDNKKWVQSDPPPPE